MFCTATPKIAPLPTPSRAVLAILVGACSCCVCAAGGGAQGAHASCLLNDSCFGEAHEELVLLQRRSKLVIASGHNQTYATTVPMDVAVPAAETQVAAASLNRRAREGCRSINDQCITNAQCCSMRCIRSTDRCGPPFSRPD